MRTHDEERKKQKSADEAKQSPLDRDTMQFEAPAAQSTNWPSSRASLPISGQRDRDVCDLCPVPLGQGRSLM